MIERSRENLSQITNAPIADRGFPVLHSMKTNRNRTIEIATLEGFGDVFSRFGDRRLEPEPLVGIGERDRSGADAGQGNPAVLMRELKSRERTSRGT